MIKENEILEVKSDRLFHDLFNEHEMQTIEWAVMQILNLSYNEIHGKVRVGNIRLTNMSNNDKKKFVDLIVYLDDKIIVIELNNNFKGNYLRNVLYAMNIINNSYIEGEYYYNKKVQGILVNLNWYNKNIKYRRRELKYGYPIDGQEEKDYLLKIININLVKYQNGCYNEFEGVDKLSKLLTIKNKSELMQITKEEKMLEEYYNKMDRLSKNKEYCRMIWDERIEKNLRRAEDYYNGVQDGIEQGIEQGIEKGIEKGIKKGINQNKEEIIINMYQDKLPIEKISKYINLSISDVESIIKKNKENTV